MDARANDFHEIAQFLNAFRHICHNSSGIRYAMGNLTLAEFNAWNKRPHQAGEPAVPADPGAAPPMSTAAMEVIFSSDQSGGVTNVSSTHNVFQVVHGALRCILGIGCCLDEDVCDRPGVGIQACPTLGVSPGKVGSGHHICDSGFRIDAGELWPPPSSGGRAGMCRPHALAT